MKKQSPLTGLHIYHDNKDRTIYKSPFNKVGYLITSDREKSFKVLSNGPMYGLIAGIFAKLLFNLNIVISVLIAVVVGGIIEYRFITFLRNCVQYPNYKPQKQVYNVEDQRNLMIKTVMYLLIGILLIISTIYTVDKNNTSYMVISWLLIAVCLFMGIKNVFTILQQRRNHE